MRQLKIKKTKDCFEFNWQGSDKPTTFNKYHLIFICLLLGLITVFFLPSVDKIEALHKFLDVLVDLLGNLM